jgi:ribonuclease R
MLRFNTNKEYSAKFDSDQSTILDIEKVKHLQYHEVIEFFMITANESAAEFAKENKLDTIFRVHDAPNTRKIDRASEFFDILGIEFDGNFSAEGIRSLVDMVKNSPAEEIVNQFLIKMQSRAIYSDHAFNQKQQAKLEDSWLEEDLDPISHFALQSKGYSHTTAPIRRACDYAVIYNIMANIHGTEPLDHETIATIIENANEMQKMIDEGEKSIKAINGVFYAENHIGEKLKGRINKIRYTSPEEGYDDELVAVVVNEDKGICAEIPISQITGRKGEYTLSPKGCAVCDQHGNIVVKLCQSLDFIIEKADRQSMNVVGRTNKQLIHTDSQKGGNNQSHITNHGKKRNKVKKYEPNKSNKKHSNKGKRPNYNRAERGYDYNPDEFGFGE